MSAAQDIIKPLNFVKVIDLFISSLGCHYSCLTCISDEECISCDTESNRSLRINKCLCSTNYYQSKDDGECIQCIETCIKS